MNSSDQTPKIPLWVFFATDLALLAAAAFIAATSPLPLQSGAILGIVACVITGACVALIPLVIWFERQKNEALDDRQRALEALAATVSNSAEQIGIATAGLQEISDAVQKSFRHAEQLPHRLQEKMAEFQSQLANATDGEKEELEKEVAALRETETERLQTISDRLTRAAAEFGKLEAATHQHLSASSEALGKLSLGTASAIGKAQVAAEQALSQARIEAARHIGEAAGQHLRSVEAAKAAALAELEARIAAAGNAIAERLARELAAKVAPALAALEGKISRFEAAAQPAPTAQPAARSPDAQRAAPAGDPANTSAPTNGQPSTSMTPPPAPSDPSGPAPVAGTPAVEGPAPGPAREEAVAPAPRRPRKVRREESAEPATAAPGSPPPHAAAEEPAPVFVNRIPEVAAVAPATAEPFALTSEPVHDRGNGVGGSPARRTPASETPADEGSAAGRPNARKGRSHTGEPADELIPPPSDEAAPASGVFERVLTSDGATRLIVTAYIGIGNRLFIRGEGPGLSWDKGVPLQFVSIGKWRWETNDATNRIRFKLLKNDEQECTALGAQTLDPGHQQEVTAAF